MEGIIPGFLSTFKAVCSALIQGFGKRINKVWQGSQAVSGGNSGILWLCSVRQRLSSFTCELALDRYKYGKFYGPKIYVVQTNTKIIQRCLLITTDPGNLIFDPTCGSGTTAYVAEQWGRRWITCDTSRVALTLARQRFTDGKIRLLSVCDR